MYLVVLLVVTRDARRRNSYVVCNMSLLQWGCSHLGFADSAWSPPEAAGDGEAAEEEHTSDLPRVLHVCGRNTPDSGRKATGFAVNVLVQSRHNPNCFCMTHNEFM